METGWSVFQLLDPIFWKVGPLCGFHILFSRPLEFFKLSSGQHLPGFSQSHLVIGGKTLIPAFNIPLNRLFSFPVNIFKGLKVFIRLFVGRIFKNGKPAPPIVSILHGVTLPSWYGWGSWDRTNASGGQSPLPYRLAIPQYWCRVWDLNPYAKRQRILNPVCLPIPPTRQMVTHGGIEPTDPGLKARWLNLLPNAPCGGQNGVWTHAPVSRPTGLANRPLYHLGICPYKVPGKGIAPLTG